MSDLISQNLNMVFTTPKGETVHALKDLKEARKIHPVIRGNRLIDELEKLINGQDV